MPEWTQVVNILAEPNNLLATVHRERLQNRSSFFRKALEHQRIWDEQDPNDVAYINVDDKHREMLPLYCSWLYGTTSFQPEAWTAFCGTETSGAVRMVAKTWSMAIDFQDRDLQAHAVCYLSRLLDRSQQYWVIPKLAYHVVNAIGPGDRLQRIDLDFMTSTKDMDLPPVLLDAVGRAMFLQRGTTKGELLEEDFMSI